MQTAHVTLINPLGLHARAAAKLVKLAARFECEVVIVRPSRERRADARSILSILELGAKEGSKLVIETTGRDEVLAVEAFSDLFGRGFDEI
jgi:phosphocarrier protein NPr/phosphocarrier protein